MTADPTPCVVVYPGLFDRRPRNHLYYRDSNLDREVGVVRRKGVVRDGLPDALEADPSLHRRGGDCLRRDLLRRLRIADTGGKRWGRIRRVSLAKLRFGRSLSAPKDMLIGRIPSGNALVALAKHESPSIT